jgi:serine-type D-Ala-D-Ala carboxypeptidase (penicillin-binding protein 5/6)
MNRSVLQGGRRRPRRTRRVAVAFLALVVLAVAAFGVYSLTNVVHRSGGGKLPVASVGGPSLRGIEETKAPSRPSTQVPPGLSLVGPNAFSVRFKGPKPRAALVFDMKSGRVLYKRGPTERLPIASLTKIMTALIVVDRTTPHDRVLITKEALDYSGSGVGVLPRGKRVPVNGLLAGLLLPSGNDAAIALAIHVAGSQARFVRMMNQRAQLLGLHCTHFVSPHGLEPGNVSCATDLAVLARLAMRQPRIYRLTRFKQLSVPFPIKNGRLYVNSTNPLLRLGYRGTIGLKTGSTDEAGHCLVAIVRRGKRELGVVLLHSPDTGTQARLLFDAAFRAGRA